MVLMHYLFGVVLVFVVLGVSVLGVVSVPYQGVVALMWASFFCCVFMAVLGRTFAALVMYIVYLGGLIVVFSYCVSVEKDKGFVHEGGYKFMMVFGVVLVVFVWLVCVVGVGDLLVYSDWEELVCLEVNGGAVFYFLGGSGLVVCSWGLLVVLFSILVILSWSRLGGLRPF